MSFLKQLCSHFHFSIFASFFESFNTFALHLCDWSIIKVIKLFVLEYKFSSELIDHSNGWISFHIKAKKFLEFAQKLEHIIMVIDQISLKIQVSQVWELLQLLTVLSLGYQIVRKVKSSDFLQVL